MSVENQAKLQLIVPMYRIFVLGAGFSRFAGLPLGNELLDPILVAAKDAGLYHFFESDLEKFKRYQKSQFKGSAEITLEAFTSFLDVEHFLELKGSDTWSASGNKTQLIIRNLIARILYRQQQAMSNEAKLLYEQFAANLDCKDIVISFNYDTVLEDAMNRIQKPYRLFPTRLSAASEYSGTVDTDAKEVVLLKMHGSINWFDRSDHDKGVAYRNSTGLDIPAGPHWSIFSHPNQWKFLPLVSGPYYPDSPLCKIEILQNMEDYILRDEAILNHPLVISPSFSKIVYLNPLIGFWRSMGNAGTNHTEVVFIGFSFPDHDEYLKIPLFQLIYNFQNFNSLHEYPALGLKSKRLKIVDFQKSPAQKKKFKKRLGIANWKKTTAIWDGFSPSTLNEILK